MCFSKKCAWLSLLACLLACVRACVRVCTCVRKWGLREKYRCSGSYLGAVETSSEELETKGNGQKGFSHLSLPAIHT